MTLTNYKLFAIRPKATTNLCTNPSFETGTTGWTTGGTNTIATSATVQRRGVYSCKCTYADSTTFLSYSITLTAAAHTGTVDIYIPSGYDGTKLAVRFASFTSATGYVVGYPDMTLTDQWQRVSTYITPVAGDLAGFLFVAEDGTAPTVGQFIYVDGAQIEVATTATTYLDGDIEGNINTGNVLEYYWGGQAHASVSYRTANTRSGGDLIDISAYCKNILLEGLGVAPVDHVAVPLTSGGETYLYSNYTSRYFTLKVVFEGSHIGDIQAKRKALLNLIKPDVTGYAQPLVLRYQGYTAAGLLASEPVDIKCQYISGLDSAPQMRFAHFADITFRLSDVALEVDGDVGAGLTLNAELTDANRIVYQDREGVWHSMAGVTTHVHAMPYTPITKVIYIGGEFTNAGGDADADYLAKWSGTAWVSVIAGINGIVRALKFDAAGNLYIGGNFTNLGDANGDLMVKWDGSSVSSLGTGLAAVAAVYSIDIDSSGNVYAGGSFTSAGGVADTGKIAMWNGTTWSSVGAGAVTGNVIKVKIDNNDNVYIAGDFTNAGDANGDYIVKWNGSSLSSLSTGLNDVCYSICFDDSNNVYLSGSFTSAGGVTVAGITKWNGSKFIALGSGLIGGHAQDLAFINNRIYLGGTFTGAGDVVLSDKVAIYIGSGIYTPLDINLPGSAQVYSLFLDHQDNIYLGYTTSGTATVAGVTTVNNPSATSYPVLDFTGIGQVQQVRNYNTGKAFFFNSLTLLSGEVVTLDLRPDKLTMTSNFRGNVKGYLVKGSNLDFPLIPGDNKIAVFMTGTDASSGGVLKYKTRLHGLDAAQYE